MDGAGKERLRSFQDDQVLDLRDIVAWLRGNFKIIAGVTLAGVLLATAYAVTAKVHFRAEIVLVPISKQSLSGVSGQLSGLAQIAGLNISNDGDTQANLAVLKSRGLLQEFIEKNGIQQAVLDGAAGISLAFRRSGAQQDVRDAVRIFDEKVRVVTEDRRAGVVTLSVVWPEAEVAAAWANGLVELANDRLRDQAVDVAERNIAYLQKEVASATVLPLQQSISRTLEIELQKLLLAKGNAEYAFKVVDPAMPPKVRYKPRRKFIVIAGFACGLALGILAALALGNLRREADQAA